jgi:ribonuclease VapC
MVLDTSAIIAAIANEPDGRRYRTAMDEADSLLISTVTLFETKVVLFARLGSQAVDLFEELVEKAGIVVVSFDDDMAKAAFAAYRRFGKGQGHPAQLNIVDCAAYALAQARSQPLLFKGADFARTDVLAA